MAGFRRLHHVVLDCPDPDRPQQLHVDVMVDDADGLKDRT